MSNAEKPKKLSRTFNDAISLFARREPKHKNSPAGSTVMPEQTAPNLPQQRRKPLPAPYPPVISPECQTR